MLAVCDLCRSRKVRCDRSNPCGNCQDAGATCTRERSGKKIASRLGVIKNRSQPAWNHPQATPEPQHVTQEPLFESQDLRNAILYDLPLEPVGVQCSRTVPPVVSPLPLFDAKIAIQRQLDHLPDLPINRRVILESALRVVTQISENFEGRPQETSDNNATSEQHKIPSIELLTWITSEFKGDKFGPFVKDYFRYISEAALKRMGIGLLRKRGTLVETAIGTVCVNLMAYKFLKCLICLETDPDLIHEFQHNALQYRSAAKAALQRIPLLTFPSLGLLQAILSGIFLHQGIGDVGLCWELTKAACRTCIDLGLDSTFRGGGTMSEEEFYCFAWCYMLDKSYAFQLGRPIPLLDVDLDTNPFKIQIHRHPMSENMLLNIELARVQAAVIPYLGSRPSERTTITPSFQEHILTQMQQVQARIDKIASTSLFWKGLDAQSEVSVMKFAYHSIKTIIFQLLQDRGEQPLGAHNLYLQSARQGLSSLMSMCLSAEKQSAVAFLHWTLLYYPIIAYFVLFCNVVATSDANDFNLMKSITDLLSHSETSSRPIRQITSIFQHFVRLSQEVFNDEKSALVRAGQLQYQLQTTPHFATVNPFQLGWSDDTESAAIPPPKTRIEDYPEVAPLSVEEFYPLFDDSFTLFHC